MTDSTIMLIVKMIIILALIATNIIFEYKNKDGTGYGVAAFLLILWWIQ